MNGAETIRQSNLSCSEAPFSVFKDLNPSEYYSLLTEGISFNHLNDLHRLLENVRLPDGVLIATCGSDGKLEQHAQSRTELIIIEEHSDLGGDDVLRNYFGSNSYCDMFDTGDNDAIDTKVLCADRTLSYAYNNPTIIYPDRVLCSYPIFPLSDTTLDIYYRAREKTLVEMSGHKNIRKVMKSQLRDHTRAIQTGVYRKASTFDPENTTQYYSELSTTYTLGFKTSFLRAVQRKLDLLTLTLKATLTWEEIAKTMPTTTVGRLAYLYDAGIIPQEVAKETSEAYAWFIQQYHHIQESYKTSALTTELPYDSVSMAQYGKTMERFVAL